MFNIELFLYPISPIILSWVSFQYGYISILCKTSVWICFLICIHDYRWAVWFMYNCSSLSLVFRSTYLVYICLLFSFLQKINLIFMSNFCFILILIISMLYFSLQRSSFGMCCSMVEMSTPSTCKWHNIPGIFSTCSEFFVPGKSCLSSRS